METLRTHGLEIGGRYRVRWLDSDYVERETFGTVSNLGEINVLLAPDAWRDATYQSVDLRRILEVSPVKAPTRLEITEEGASWALVLRTAAKEHRCICADEERSNGSKNPNHRVECRGTIRRGEQYVENLGESAGYSSGSRYCRACAPGAWGPRAVREVEAE